MHEISNEELQARVAEWLAEQGTPVVFGLMGVGNLELIARLDQHGVRYVSGRHENGVVAAADAWARVTSRVGVATVSRGAGVSNTVTALVEARKSSTPLVLFTGRRAEAETDTQYLDQESVLTGAGIRYLRLQADALEGSLTTIFDYARANRLPVAIELDTTSDPLDLPKRASAIASDHDTITTAATLVATAERPVILAGRGAVVADAGATIEQLAQRAGAMLTTSAMANGMFTGNPSDLGVCGGFASAESAAVLRHADLLLVFGASLNKWTMRHGELFASAVPVVRCDIDSAALAESPPGTLTIVGDARAVAEQLTSAIPPRPDRFDEWAVHAATPGHAVSRSEPGMVDPEEICRAIASRLPSRRTVSVDSGHFFGYAIRHVRPDEARSNVFSQAFLSMGLSIASGIGAAIARPEAIAVVVAGDGGTVMSIGELDTATRLGLRMIVCVMNDAAYGMEVHELNRSGFRPELAQFNDLDFAAIARGFGAEGATIRSVADLSVIDQWLPRADRPLVLDCKIDPTKLADWYVERTAARAAEVPA